LFGPKIVIRVTRFLAPVPVQEGLAVTFRFLTAGDSTPVCNFFSKFLNKQIVPEEYQAIVDALTENIQLKNSLL